MSTPTEIVRNGKAVAASVTASIIAALVVFIPFCSWVVTIAPEKYKATIAAVGAGAGTALVALRTAYAWLDKSNTSFGRVDGPPPPPPGDDAEPVDEADLDDNLDDAEEVAEDEFDEAVDLGVDAPPVD